MNGCTLTTCGGPPAPRAEQPSVNAGRVLLADAEGSLLEVEPEDGSYFGAVPRVSGDSIAVCAAGGDVPAFDGVIGVPERGESLAYTFSGGVARVTWTPTESDVRFDITTVEPGPTSVGLSDRIRCDVSGESGSAIVPASLIARALAGPARLEGELVRRGRVAAGELSVELEASVELAGPRDIRIR